MTLVRAWSFISVKVGIFICRFLICNGSSLLKGLSKIMFQSNCCEVDLNYSCGQNYNRFALLLEIPQEIRFEEDTCRRDRRSGATLIEWVQCQPLATLQLTLFIWKKQQPFNSLDRSCTNLPIYQSENLITLNILHLAFLQFSVDQSNLKYLVEHIVQKAS